MDSINDITFDDIFNLYYPRCVLFATKLMGNKYDAEEAVQELFINLWVKGKINSVKGSLKSYLFKSVFNICIDMQRKNKVKQKREGYREVEEEPSVPFANPVIEQELETYINTAINQLPEKRKNIFLLSRNEGLTYSQIAEKLNLSEKTVETQISRSLKQLRHDLSDYIPILLFV